MNRIFAWIRQVISKLFKRDTIADKVGCPIAVNDEMANTIELWLSMYMGKAPWLAPIHMRSLGIPAQIASDIAQMTTIEMEVKVEGSARANYIAEQLTPVLESIRPYTEYACASGGIMFKPYPDTAAGTIEVDFNQADEFLPIAHNSRGEITDCIFVGTEKIGQYYFRRLERHTFKSFAKIQTEGNTGNYTVTNRAFRSHDINDLGQEVPLSSVEAWKDLQPEAVLRAIKQPLFSYFKMPFANNTDPKSPLGVSVYAKACDLIEDADRQYTRLLWEYEGGEMAVEAADDVFEKDKYGKPIIPAGRERLFRPNKIDAATAPKGSELLKTHSPKLRDANYMGGLDKILRQIEDKCGLARGSLADPQAEARTATEIKLLRQRTYVSITDIQKALQTAIDRLLYIIDTYATLYNLAPAGSYTATYKWDDSVITDSETQREQDRQDVRDGMMQKWEYRMKWYGEDQATAQKMAPPAQSDNTHMGFGEERT